jgi:hypothetical protein
LKLKTPRCVSVINELEMRLEAYNTGNATLRTTDHTDAFNEFQGFRTTVERASQGIVIVHLEGVITYTLIASSCSYR